MGKRYSVFYLVGSLAAAFGGILAFGLMQMDGLQGYRGWRWIFIVEGCVCSSCIPVLAGTEYADISSQLTCLVAFLGYIFLISFPDNQKSRSIRFLSEEERLFIIARVNQDRGDADLEKFSFKKWLGGGADWKIWAYGLCKRLLSLAFDLIKPSFSARAMVFTIQQGSDLGLLTFIRLRMRDDCQLRACILPSHNPQPRARL